MRYAIFENLDKAKSILKSKEIPLTDTLFLDIKEKLQKSNRLGYIGWLMSLLYENNQNKEQVLGIVDTLIQPAFKETSTWFTKDILELKTTEEFTDQLNKARNRKLAKGMWSKFPSEQKKLIDWEDPNYSALLVRLWDVKYDNLINKISRYKSTGALLHEIRIALSQSTDSDLSHFENLCKENDIKILYLSHQYNILIAEVKNSDQVNVLARDSSWCIRGESMLKSYLRHDYFHGIQIPKRQIIAINTDEVGNYRKIGVTLGMGVTAAHLWNDARISDQELFQYFQQKGFDLNSLIVTFKKGEIDEDWVKKNLTKKINFNSYIEIVKYFKIKIKNRLLCWKYILPEGVYSFYTEEELQILSRDINFLKYLATELKSVPSFFNGVSTYIFRVFVELGDIEIKNSDPLPEYSDDLIKVCIKHFKDKTLSKLAEVGFLFDKDENYCVYSKHEIFEKNNYKIKKYKPSLGDVIYLTDRQIKNWAYDIEKDIRKNLYKYHKMGYKTIKECLDKFRSLYVYKLEENLELSYIEIPNTTSSKEIFDTYFKDKNYRYKYNFYDFLNLPKKELMDNISLMPPLVLSSTTTQWHKSIVDSNLAQKVIKRSLKDLGKSETTKYLIRSGFELVNINNLVPELFIDTFEYMKNSERRWTRFKLDIDSLIELDKKQIIDAIKSNNFIINLDDASTKEFISNLKIDPKIASKKYDSFNGKNNFFDIFYDKKDYKLYVDFISNVRDLNNDQPISIIECFLLLHLDEIYKSKLDRNWISLEKSVDRYLKEGQDDELKNSIKPIQEDFKFSNLVRRTMRKNSELISKCDTLLEDPEKSKNMWNSIVKNILSSVTPENKISRSKWTDYDKVKEEEAITEDLVNEQVLRFKDLIPEVVSEDIFRSPKFRVVWETMKPGSFVLDSYYKIKYDAYMIAQCLLDENPNTQFAKIYDLYKMMFQQKKSGDNPRMISPISDLLDKYFDKLSADDFVDFFESIPNNRENKKTKQHILSILLYKHISKIKSEMGFGYWGRTPPSVLRNCNKRLVDMGLSLLNKADRISIGLEQR